MNQESNPQETQATVPSQPTTSWLDSQALAYSETMIWLHLLICTVPGLIVGTLFALGCKTPEGKAVGKRLLQYSGLGIAIGMLFRLLVFQANSGSH